MRIIYRQVTRHNEEHDAINYWIKDLDKIWCEKDCSKCILRFICYTITTPAFSEEELAEAGVYNRKMYAKAKIRDFEC